MISPTPTAAQRAAFWTWLGLAGALLTVLFIAYGLEPDARGYGTHTQLGLPPCGLRALTGLPCPGCGLTTAFAYAIRGDVVSAARANPFGLALFLSTLAVVPFCIVAWLRRWTLDDALDRVALDRWAVLLAASGIVVWVARLFAAT